MFSNAITALSSAVLRYRIMIHNIRLEDRCGWSLFVHPIDRASDEIAHERNCA
jgi:hypothetical protein